MGAQAAMKAMTCSQRIKAATVKKTQVFITETQALDAEALFYKYDTEATNLLSRGNLTELLKEIGLDKDMGEAFSASAQLAFDAHSADSHFLSLPEFKQLYYYIGSWKPKLLPRDTKLRITVMGARGLPPADANGKADPFCILMCQGKPRSKSMTQVKEKTLDPWWGEDFNDNYGYEENGESLLFEVHDYDKGSESQLMCTAVLPSTEFDRAGGFDGLLPLVIDKKFKQGCPFDTKGFSPVLKVRVYVAGQPVPPPRLRIGITSAKGLPPADPNGKSDPFCSVMIIGKPYSKGSTKVIPKTLDPVWEEELSGKYRYEDGDHLIFEVRDYDGKGSKSELLGRAVLENAKFHKKGGFVGNLSLVDVAKGQRPPDSGAKVYTPTLQLNVSIRDFDSPRKAEEEAASTATGEAASDAAAATAQPASV